MAQTTFSGPILAGTIKNTTGTTVGTDMKNTGQVVMAQTFAIDLSSGAIAAQASNVIIPANSQIIDCIFDIITAANTFVATVGAITEIGAKPIFVDCDDTFCIDTKQIEKP